MAEEAAGRSRSHRAGTLQRHGSHGGSLRLAREHVKKATRRKGFNLYEVSAKEITKSAEALLAARPK